MTAAVGRGAFPTRPYQEKFFTRRRRQRFVSGAILPATAAALGLRLELPGPEVGQIAVPHFFTYFWKHDAL